MRTGARICAPHITFSAIPTHPLPLRWQEGNIFSEENRLDRREGQRQRQRPRDRARQKDTETASERDRERDRGRHTERKRETGRDREQKGEQKANAKTTTRTIVDLSSLLASLLPAADVVGIQTFELIQTGSSSRHRLCVRCARVSEREEWMRIRYLYIRGWVRT